MFDSSKINVSFNFLISNSNFADEFDDNEVSAESTGRAEGSLVIDVEDDTEEMQVDNRSENETENWSIK